MPCDMTIYGEGWKDFSNFIRFERAQQQCECFGKCGLHSPRRCTERHHTKARYARGLVRLAIAHLCECHPPCKDPNHVIAACQRCHLRIDRWKHAQARLARQRPASYTPPTPS